MTFYWNNQNQLVPAAVLSAAAIGSILSRRPESGLWLNYTPLRKMGELTDNDNTESRDVWELDSYEHMNYPRVAVPAEISSTDAADSATGIGARTVKVYYLDNEYMDKVQEVALDGLNPVSMPADILRVLWAWVVTGDPATGESRRANFGTIAIVNPAGPFIMAEIVAGQNQTLMTHFTVPANRDAILTYFYVQPYSASAHNDDASFYQRTFDASDAGVFRKILPHRVTDKSGQTLTNSPPLDIFGPKTDLVVRAQASSAGNRPVIAHYGLELVDAAA